MRAEAHLHIWRAKRGFPDPISMRFLPNGLVAYVGFLCLTDAKFVVQPAGLRKFRESGVKNVHAYVRGTFDMCEPESESTHADFMEEGWREAYYNPASTSTFVDRLTGNMVDSAPNVILSRTKVYYRD